MCQHCMITPHQANSLGYEIVVAAAANLAPVDALLCYFPGVVFLCIRSYKALTV